MSIDKTNFTNIFKELYGNQSLLFKSNPLLKLIDPYILELEEVTLSSLKEQLCLKP